MGRFWWKTSPIPWWCHCLHTCAWSRKSAFQLSNIYLNGSTSMVSKKISPSYLVKISWVTLDVQRRMQLSTSSRARLNSESQQWHNKHHRINVLPRITNETHTRCSVVKVDDNFLLAWWREAICKKGERGDESRDLLTIPIGSLTSEFVSLASGMQIQQLQIQEYDCP